MTTTAGGPATNGHVSPSDAATALGRGATPLVKWAGGKSQLLEQIRARVPRDFATYHEPFLGGGAVYFSMAPRRARISDLNGALMNLYAVVRDNVGEYLRRASALEAQYNQASWDHKQTLYYEMRSLFNMPATDPIAHAVQFVFLNKAGFNGLYRENRSGAFNVPWGKRERIVIADAASTCRASDVLRGAELSTAPFDAVLDHAVEGDFVYFDPPYVPLDGYSSFTSYQATGFGMPEQEHLAEVVRRLAARGVYVMVSNSDTPVVRELYRDWNYEVVMARRNINSRGAGRGAVAEALVRTYE